MDWATLLVSHHGGHSLHDERTCCHRILDTLRHTSCEPMTYVDSSIGEVLGAVHHAYKVDEGCER